MEVEAVAEILARHMLVDWNPDFLPKMRWPEDCSKEEQGKCRGVATMVINALKKARRNAEGPAVRHSVRKPFVIECDLCGKPAQDCICENEPNN
jgi:hypothetical protein